MESVAWYASDAYLQTVLHFFKGEVCNGIWKMHKIQEKISNCEIVKF